MTESIFCGQCGTSLPSGSGFCTECGAPVSQSPAAPPNAASARTEAPRPPRTTGVIQPPNQTPRVPKSGQSKRTGSVYVALGAVTATLIAVFFWNQLQSENQNGTPVDTTIQQSTTTVEPVTTSSTSTTTSTSSTTTTIAQLSGYAPPEYWISGSPMAQPSCDGGYITIIASMSGDRAATQSRAYPDANYLRTDITCASLNPFFSSGPLQGQPIYLVYFGPYYSRYDAQAKCRDLGIRKKANCYIAPLTDDASDRSVRFGPLDP
jgi:hypothetical protein